MRLQPLASQNTEIQALPHQRSSQPDPFEVISELNEEPAPMNENNNIDNVIEQ